jgi:hypothetical protein
LLLAHATWIAAEILFYRGAIKKIGAESPVPAEGGNAPKKSLDFTPILLGAQDVVLTTAGWGWYL